MIWSSLISAGVAAAFKSAHTPDLRVALRGAMGIDGSINYDSLAYRSSYVGGNVVGGTALYAGAAFNYVPALGPTSSFIGHPAYGGRTISGLRSGLRFGWGRGGNGPMLRGAYRNYKVDIHKMPK